MGYAGGSGGFATFLIDGSGNLTYVENDYRGQGITSVWGDGTYVYASYDGTGHGVYSYTVNGSGESTFVDAQAIVGFGTGIWADSSFI